MDRGSLLASYQEGVWAILPDSFSMKLGFGHGGEVFVEWKVGVLRRPLGMQEFIRFLTQAWVGRMLERRRGAGPVLYWRSRISGVTAFQSPHCVNDRGRRCSVYSASVAQRIEQRIPNLLVGCSNRPTGTEIPAASPGI